MSTQSSSLLDQANTPQALRKLSSDDLPRLADALRKELIETISLTGGHLGAGLGVVELTIALHYLFDTPHDRLIWDVGHQAYPHKMLTGRRQRMKTLRQKGGLSGFTKRSESIYDPFGAGHSSTSISAAFGMAQARDLAKNPKDSATTKTQDRHVVAVIGDGAMSAGMAYEAMNNAGSFKNRLIVILNDNDMSIAPPVGAMSAYLSRLISSRPYRSVRAIMREVSETFPLPLKNAARRAEEYARGMVTGGTLFEELGFYYVGPIDGHNFDHLLPVLRNVKKADDGPILVHVVTNKGKGYAPAEQAADKFHGVSKFNLITGAPQKPKTVQKTYTKVFSETLIQLAAQDEKIVAVTAAMPGGTGLQQFAEKFPDRCFDVGIAEQHAVTFAAGLAAEGYKPFVAIYSTFLQRAYDQIIHDVALQNLPIRFMIDRAGLVGADGASHAGAFDIAYLGCLPNMMLMAAANGKELMDMVASAAAYQDGPCALRYPRGEIVEENLVQQPDLLPIGKADLCRQGNHIALLCYGHMLSIGQDIYHNLARQGINASLVNLRFANPLDTETLAKAANNHELLVTIEDGAPGGVGSKIATFLAENDYLQKTRLRQFTLPNRFIDHASPAEQYEMAGLTALQITNQILACLHRSGEKAIADKSYNVSAIS